MLVADSTLTLTAFNSLSRDHVLRLKPDTRAEIQVVAFNSLSRDHIKLELREWVLDIFAIKDFQLPLSGSLSPRRMGPS